MLRRTRAAGITLTAVVADAEYGDNSTLRRTLHRLQLPYALGISPTLTVFRGTPTLRVGVVNREREATPETPSWNVIIVTTGIARRWFEEGDILPGDTLLVDEIHQTSAELELCLALGKRRGCRFIWLSATVDPTFYKNYLGSETVLKTTAFDPERAVDGLGRGRARRPAVLSSGRRS
jgi:hypothetical protein